MKIQDSLISNFHIIELHYRYQKTLTFNSTSTRSSHLLFSILPLLQKVSVNSFFSEMFIEFLASTISHSKHISYIVHNRYTSTIHISYIRIHNHVDSQGVKIKSIRSNSSETHQEQLRFISRNIKRMTLRDELLHVAH